MDSMRAVSCSTRVRMASARPRRAAGWSHGRGPHRVPTRAGRGGGRWRAREWARRARGIDRDERAVDPRRWGGAGGSVGRCREGARFSGARIGSDTDGRRVRGREARTAMPLASVTFCAAARAWRRSRRRCRSWSPPTAPRATDADAEPKLLRFSARPTKRALARDRPRTSCAFRGRWKRARVRTTRAPSDPLSRSGDAEATSESENVRALSVSVPRETRASASERLFLPARDGEKARRRRRRVRGQDVLSAPPAKVGARSPARWDSKVRRANKKAAEAGPRGGG